MKTVQITKAAVLGLATLAIHVATHATEPSAGIGGNISIGSTVHGGFNVGANGSSSSYATNSEAATVKVGAMGNYTPGFSTVNAGIYGDTSTQSFGKAYNVSTGSGFGGATSLGSVNTNVNGTAGIHTVTQGFNGGNAGTQSTNIIQAGTNQGSALTGQTSSGFSLDLHYAAQSSGTAAPAGSYGSASDASRSLSTQTTGYANGSNQTVSFTDLNAAGIANISSSGGFFAKTGLSTGTYVSAP